MAYRTAGLVLVGGVLGWMKSLSGTPALPAGFVECNGQVLSDAQSVYDTKTIPALNATSEPKFLRGSMASPRTSGDTGGRETHRHERACVQEYGPVPDPCDCMIWEGLWNMTTVNHLPPYYETVWIMRVK